MKQSFRRSFLSIITLLALMFGAIGSTPAHAMNLPQRTTASSPEGLLNPDGTLSMGKSFNGTLDIADWNVQMDPLRGPVFAPAALASLGQWASVGTGSNSVFAGGDINSDNVTAIAVSGTDVYVGGYFTNIKNHGTILPAADYIAKWDTLTGNWSALGSNGAGDGSIPSSAGPVSSIAISGTDVYIGGNFTDVNNNGTILPAADFIARWDTLTGNWSALGSGIGGDPLYNNVYSIAVSGTDVYVGGEFTDANAIPAADYIAKWNGTSWSALGSNGAGDGSVNATVYSIAVSGTDVYAGGSFHDVNNNGTLLTAADSVAKWDAQTGNWSALGSNGAGDGSLDANIFAVAVSGTSVYVGGAFSNPNSNGTIVTAADNIAKWDTVTGNWSALGSNGDGTGSIYNSIITSIAVSGTDVYVGGQFPNVNNNGTILTAADYIAKWNGTNWSALNSNGAGNGSLNHFVNAIAVSGTDVYVGGDFRGVNNNGTGLRTADLIVKWDGTNWSGLGYAVDGSLNNSIHAIAVMGTDVYVGGSFTDLSNNQTIVPAADYLAKWNGSAWSAIGSNGAGEGSLNGAVYSLAVSGTDLYVGGEFTNVNNNGTILNAADYIAKWNTLTNTWSALSSNGTGNGSLSGGSRVLALAVSGADLYVGGHFIGVNDNGTERGTNYIARWNGSVWSSLEHYTHSNWNRALNGDVNAIAILGTDVYVGGAFINVNIEGGGRLGAADYVAKWDGTVWSALGSNGDTSPYINGAINGGGAPAVVNALAIIGTDLYVGGNFDYFNNNGTFLNTAHHIAKWDTLTSNWSALGSNGAGGASLNNGVNTLLVNGANLYVGGQFTNVNNNGTILPKADHIAKWDILTSNWSALGSNSAGNGALNDTVHAIAVNNADVYVGGDFKNAGSNGTILQTADYIAAYGIDLRPTVIINQAAGQTDPTNTRLLNFTATFSEPVSGFTNTDVNISLSAACAPTVTVTGSGANYNVALTGMTRECIATVSIPAGKVNSISHPASVNLASTSTDNSQQFLYAVKLYLSVAANDGWVLESAAGSNIGGSMNNAATILSVGDDAANRSYRMLSRFDTSTDPVPTAAVVAGGNYRVIQAGITGTNPLSTHGSLRTFLNAPYFGSSANLETLDYQAGADTGACIFETTILSDNGYRCIFFTAALPFIPKSGILDLRSQFDADNADSSADLLNIYSGNAASQRPKLYITYYFLP